MPRQVLTLKLGGITAGDYLTWCRDPEPPALDYTLRSVRVDADPLGDTITVVLDWKHPAPSPRAAAIAAGLPLSPDVEVHVVAPRTSCAPLRRRLGRQRVGPQVPSPAAAAT
jgi:hypothetical protein